jgi:hypothetical protein
LTGPHSSKDFGVTGPRSPRGYGATSPSLAQNVFCGKRHSIMPQEEGLMVVEAVVAGGWVGPRQVLGMI